MDITNSKIPLIAATNITNNVNAVFIAVAEAIRISAEYSTKGGVYIGLWSNMEAY